jgi:hypothetical protein
MKADALISALQCIVQGEPQKYDVKLMVEVQGDDWLQERELNLGAGRERYQIYIYQKG